MSLQIDGKVESVGAEVGGDGANGPWRKQEFILMTDGDYPKPVALVVWGDNIDRFGISVGSEITAHIDIASREYEGRWYTDVKAWRVEQRRADAPRPGGGSPF